MKTNKGTLEVSDLRQRAEKELEIAAGSTEAQSEMSPEEMARLIHELQVHQIELQMQNDELRRIQDDLEKTRDKYSHLYDFAPIGYFTVDQKGTINEANLTIASMLGLDRSALIGRPFSRFVLRDDQDTFYKHRQRLLETEGPQSCELRLVKRDGHAFHARLECTIITNRGNDDKQIRVAVSDITERHLIAKALQEAHDGLERRVEERTTELRYEKELLQTILDHIPVMICLFDPDGEVKVLNKHYTDTIGWKSEKSENTVTTEACNQDLVTCEGLLSDVRRGGQSWRDSIVRTKDGRDLETTWTNVKLSNGSLIAIGIDISERKRAEEQIRLYLGRLERSNQELQDFVFAASHDLQEPLRKIQSFGSLLVDEFEDSISEEGCDFLTRMQDAAARMRGLIDSLLAYSRVTTKISPFSKVDLGEAVQEALANLEILGKETNGTVNVDELPTVEGDKFQIIQLFQNLIGNALKFHRKGESPRVKIHSRLIHGERSYKGDFYEIRVEDDGIGFDEIYLSRIFSPFQRLHGRSEYEGVGVGLAICLKIVERHNGHLNATSRPGRGAVFLVTLPGK